VRVTAILDGNKMRGVAWQECDGTLWIRAVESDIARDDAAAKFVMAVAAPFTKSIAQGGRHSLLSES
jgi:hypothetical protein